MGIIVDRRIRPPIQIGTGTVEIGTGTVEIESHGFHHAYHFFLNIGGKRHTAIQTLSVLEL